MAPMMVYTALRRGWYIGRRPCLYRSLGVCGFGSPCETNSYSGTVLIRIAPRFLKTSIINFSKSYSSCISSEDEDEDEDDDYRTYKEFVEHHNWLMRNPKPHRLGKDQITDFSDIPPTVDWRKRRAVTRVKDQGFRPTCWAFAVVASIESFIKIRTGKLRSLSVKQLVSRRFFDCGRVSGKLSLGFADVVKSRGLTSWNVWPYDQLFSSGQQFAKVKNVLGISVATIDGFEIARPCNEIILKSAVARQPVAVSVHANIKFMRYSGGVFLSSRSEFGTDLNHCMVIVGYGTSSDGLDFWLCKNSFGIGWGEKGYIRLVRNTNNVFGICGIAIEPMYPI